MRSPWNQFVCKVKPKGLIGWLDTKCRKRRSPRCPPRLLCWTTRRWGGQHLFSSMQEKEGGSVLFSLPGIAEAWHDSIHLLEHCDHSAKRALKLAVIYVWESRENNTQICTEASVVIGELMDRQGPLLKEQDAL